MDMLRHAHTPENHARLCARKATRHSAQYLRVNATNTRHFFGAEIFQMGFFRLPILGIGFDILLVVKLFFNDHMHDRIQHRHICTGPKLQHMRCKTLQSLPARIHHNQLAAAFGKLFEICGGNGVIFNRVGANHNRHIGIFNFVKRRRNRARSNIFQKRRHRRGMAQPRAVINIVMAKALTDHFLEQIRLFIGAFGAAKPGHGPPTMLRS